MKSKNKKMIIFLTLLLALNILLAILERGSFGHLIIVLISSLYIAIPLLVFSGISYALYKWFDLKKALKISGYCFSGAVLFASLWISLIAGGYIAKYDVHRAKTYCESYIPMLREYKKNHGSYPESLPEISEKVPGLLENWNFIILQVIRLGSVFLIQVNLWASGVIKVKMVNGTGGIESSSDIFFGKNCNVSVFLASLFVDV